MNRYQYPDVREAAACRANIRMAILLGFEPSQ
jgi:hypothetical protein